jgi:uroporphyrin-III C-methyltransferase
MHTSAQHLPTIYLVGAGPGDADLLTIKAVKTIRQATVLLVDDLVDDEVLRYARRSARIVHVGKRGGCASTPQAFIERLMIAEAQRGERVVRLKGGDPFVFGRGGEELDHLRSLGLRVEVVNGITAGVAAAGAIGVPLTHRAHAHGVLFVTGHPQGGAEGLDWVAIGATAKQGITLVIYMGIKGADVLQRGLLQALPASTPAAVVQHASLPQQRHVVCRLDELSQAIATEGIASPAVIVIGNVLRGAQAAALQPPSHRASA